MFAASMYGTLKKEKEWATSREFARKYPVLIAFAMVVGTSTWQPRIKSSIFITMATPRAFDCLVNACTFHKGLWVEHHLLQLITLKSSLDNFWDFLPTIHLFFLVL